MAEEQAALYSGAHGLPLELDVDGDGERGVAEEDGGRASANAKRAKARVTQRAASGSLRQHGRRPAGIWQGDVGSRSSRGAATTVPQPGSCGSSPQRREVVPLSAVMAPEVQDQVAPKRER